MSLFAGFGPASSAMGDSLGLTVMPQSTVGGTFTNSPVEYALSGNALTGNRYEVYLRTSPCTKYAIGEEREVQQDEQYLYAWVPTPSVTYNEHLLGLYYEKKGVYYLCAYEGIEGERPLALSEVRAQAEASFLVTETLEEAEARERAAEEARRETEYKARQATCKSVGLSLESDNAFQEEEQLCTERLRQRAKEEQEEAQWNALEAAALAKPVSILSVRAIGRPGSSVRRPGRTILRVVTSPFAEVTIKLRRYGHRTEHWSNEPTSLTSSTATLEPEYVWSCKHPGGVYRYTVSARTKTGRMLVRAGRFYPVSVTRCHALERAERQARERGIRRFNEHVRHERESEEALRREGERNCTARGGAVVHLSVEGEPRIACRAPGGGLLPWIP